MKEVNRGNSSEAQNNEELMKKSVDSMLEVLDKAEKKDRQRQNRKTIFLIISIIIEIVVIFGIIQLQNKKSEYEIKVKCSNKTEHTKDNYSIKMINTYYFNKHRKVSKTENDVIYIFDTKEDYDKYKNNILKEKNYDFRGLEIKKTFDDINYVYSHKTIYTYDELKKNRQVSYRNDMFKFNAPDQKEKTVIKVLDYDTVLNINNNMKYICE